MTPDQRFSLILSGIGLLFTIMVVTLGLVVRIVQKWTRTEERLTNLTEDVKTLARNSDRRITWLEQNTWRRGTR